jgi:two-component system, response regulator PdtaR
LFDRRSEERLGVLVVEPKDFVAVRLKAQVERLGHYVLGLARDGWEAVAAAERLRPRLILMESRLPGLDGIAAARAIVSDRPVPVILLTPYAGAELVRQAQSAGVVAYLTSVDQRRLLSAIEVVLERFGEFRILRTEENDPSEALATWRLVNQAKKVLITRVRLSEAEAFRHILGRKQSAHRSLRETAWTIIQAEQVFSRPDFAHCLELLFYTVRRDPGPRSRHTPRLATPSRVEPQKTVGPTVCR